MSYYIGGDPGKSGGVAVVTAFGKATVYKWPENEREGLDLLSVIMKERDPEVICVGSIEKVGAMPGQGVTSMFSFGRSYQAMRSSFFSARVPFTDVLPRKWQQAVGIKKKDKNESSTHFKNRLKAMAQQLYPEVKVTLATCDALLIAHYTMLTWRKDVLPWD